MAHLAKVGSKIGNLLQLEAATTALCLRFRSGSGRMPHDTKARRARELRPRRNYMLREEVEKQRRSPLTSYPRAVEEEAAVLADVVAPRDYKHVMPEFLPNPDPLRRDLISEKLERMDMYRRRSVINIPEFYVGSIMAVTMADEHAPGKVNRFVGICIHRGGHGLRANFTLRNVIDGLGVEIMFDLYNVTLQKIEVLKLEKRLDDELYYLRDAPPEHSTVPLNFAPVPLPKGASIPVNTTKVKLNPRPWHERWERYDLKGIEELELSRRQKERWEKAKRPWERFDIMKQHRRAVDDDEAEAIMKEVYQETRTMEKAKGKRKAVGKKSS